MLKSIKDTMGSQDGQQCSYSRRKKEKKAKIKFDDSINEEPITNGVDDQVLIDSFVQEVIEKAKMEYLRQCKDVHDEDKTQDPSRSTSSIGWKSVGGCLCLSRYWLEFKVTLDDNGFFTLIVEMVSA
ncbi:hypothetical protein ACF0H5_016753 [Mactra antiquata]